MVFQEGPELRLERWKRLQIKENPDIGRTAHITRNVNKLEAICFLNEFNLTYFATVTKKHFFGQIKKKNNLCFVGLPSTGKTMVMESLVQMQFNYERLTGLTPGSSFNFSSLVHTNAWFMDKCKLTENQFEQCKLLAVEQPMSTDIKYKSRHTIKDCRLYTASNYPIELANRYRFVLTWVFGSIGHSTPSGSPPPLGLRRCYSPLLRSLVQRQGSWAFRFPSRRFRCHQQGCHLFLGLRWCWLRLR